MSLDRRTRSTLWLALLALVGLAIHAWFIAAADALDSDRALVLLMARSFAEGELSLYFWQQNYMAALEPLLLTPLAWVGLATPVAAGTVALGLTAAMAVLSVRLARRLGGEPWMALLVWAVPPAIVVHHHVSLYGARLAASALVLFAFVHALDAEERRSWIAVGAMGGLAYFGDHLMLGWCAGIAWLALSRGALGSFALGALPVVVVDTAAAMVTPAFHLSGPNDPGAWLAGVAKLFLVTIPQLLGILLDPGPGPVFEPPAPVVPEGWAWLAFAVPGVVAVAGLLWALWRHRLSVLASYERRSTVGALVLVGIVTMGVTALTGGGGERWPVRYLVPLWPALSVVAAVAVARWRPARRPLAAALVLPAVFTLVGADDWPPRGPAAGEAARAEAELVEAAVRDAGVDAVWSNYWDTYRMALLVGDRPRWLSLTVIERRPTWVEETRDERAGYLLRTEDRAALEAVAEASREAGAATPPARDVAGYRLVVADRSVPGVVSMNAAPPRGWQWLAALAAGLLFPGMLLGVYVVGRAAGQVPSGPAGAEA